MATNKEAFDPELIYYSFTGKEDGSVTWPNGPPFYRYSVQREDIRARNPEGPAEPRMVADRLAWDGLCIDIDRDRFEAMKLFDIHREND